MADVEPVQQFAANLRALRERAGISQEELGHQAGLHRTEISLLERAGREPRLTTIVRLARTLGVKPTVLLKKIE
jgi:transcriptional regulator with XRE-family HTH domain